MKNTIYSLGFTLIVGCHVTAERTNSQKSEYAATPGFKFQPLAKDDSLRYYNAVKDFFEKALLSNRNFNGGVLIAKGASIIYEEYKGYKNPQTKAPLDTNSAMHIASVSKNFAAAAVLKLAQDGRVNLSDSLSKFFPNFPYSGVTVKMLMNHRSGLPNYVHYLERMGWDKNQYVTNSDVLNSLYTMHPAPEFRAGTRFSYSNTNFVLLAMIVEKLTGMPYPDYLKKNFFEPLQMNDTYVFSLSDSITAIKSYKANGSTWKWDFLENTYGDKNIYTTPRDLLKWSLALSEGKIMNQALLDSAFTPYSFERPGVHNYGLGWRLLMLKNGKKVIYHNGRWHGSNAAFAKLTDEDITIIIIGNRYDVNIYNTARKAYDIFGDYLQGGPTIDEEGEITYHDPPPVHHAKRFVVRKNSHHKRYYSSTTKSVAKTIK
ncbi:MAG: serine hydrolase domain-containing protein [Chitinophagales bacterium]